VTAAQPDGLKKTIPSRPSCCGRNGCACWRGKGLDAAKVGKAAGEIEATAHRIARIVDALRSFARDGRNSPVQPESVAAIIRETVDLCAQRFVPFFTTEGIGKGTGLGLSVSKGLAEGHGGKLEFGATAPATRFTLTLRRTMDSTGN